MIIQVPIQFSNGKTKMRVEVQLRTLAMDFWASLDHQMKYKKNLEDSEEIIEELTEDYDLPDVEIRKVLIEELTKAFYAVSEKLYQAAAAAQGAEGAAPNAGTPDGDGFYDGTVN